jgi:hypothetical protein
MGQNASAFCCSAPPKMRPDGRRASTATACRTPHCAGSSNVPLYHAPARHTRPTLARGARHRRGPPRAEGHHAPHARPPTPRPTRASGSPDAPRSRGDVRRGRPCHRHVRWVPDGFGHPRCQRSCPTFPRRSRCPSEIEGTPRRPRGAGEVGDRAVCSTATGRVDHDGASEACCPTGRLVSIDRPSHRMLCR